MTNNQQVHLFYRKSRATGNFSIEVSFDRMLIQFPTTNFLQIKKIISSYESIGFLPRIKAILEASKLAGSINHITGDVHYLAFGLPKNKIILTIHDCGFMQRPSKVKRILLKWFWLILPIQRCKYVVAVSEATKKDILHYTGCSPEKVKVIPTLIGMHFKKKDFVFNEACPRILHIGMAPNKNFERHVKAIHGLVCHFHIIGKLEEAHLLLLQHYNIQFSQEFNISNEAMQKAYEDCDIVLFASTLEGFGMPIIEGQTVGRPVVTSNLSSMPEVAGEGACLVNPFDVNSIRLGIEHIIQDRDYRAQLLIKGFDNSKKYSIKEVIQQYSALYESVTSENNYPILGSQI